MTNHGNLTSKKLKLKIPISLFVFYTLTAFVRANDKDSLPNFLVDNKKESLPNIVVILADDLGYGDLGCYGATEVKTPNIDRLADEGMRFTNAHSPASICTPSRYNLMTGRYCWRTWVRHGVVWANDPLLIEESRLTVASLFKNAGYTTGCIGKWHLGFGKPGSFGWDDALGPDFNDELYPGPLDVGFDYFFGMPAVGQHPNIFIEGRHVVNLSPNDPIRFINDPRPQYRVEYSVRPRTSPTNLQMISGKSAEYVFEDAAIILTEKAITFIEKNRDKRFFLFLAPRNIHAPLRPNASFKGSSEIGVYGDFINELDWSIGQVLNTLDRLKLAENTLVIFASDNGGVKAYKRIDHAEIHGHRINGRLRGQKTEVYEGGTRIPFMVRWPAFVPAGRECQALVANTDLLSTFAELIGRKLTIGEGEDSFSFLSTLLGKPVDQSLRQSVVTDAMMGIFAIQEGAWKLILGQGGGGFYPEDEDTLFPLSINEPAGQLYNLEDDLGERKNLYMEKPEMVKHLTKLLERIKTEDHSRPYTKTIDSSSIKNNKLKMKNEKT